ncbi:MAG: FliH/SctL family protein [Candidatus Bruticola sp.]
MSTLALFKGNNNGMSGSDGPPKRSALLKQRPAGITSGAPGGDLSDFVPTNFGATKVSSDGGRIFRGRSAAYDDPPQPNGDGEFHPHTGRPPAASASGKVFGGRRADHSDYKLPPISSHSVSVPTGDPPPPGAPLPPPPPPVDKEIIAKAEAKAKEIIAQAQNQIQQMINQANEQIQQFNEQAAADAEHARQAAFQQGTLQGIEEGRRLAHREYVDLMLMARDLYVQAIKERRKLIENTEPALAKLSISIAEKIIGLEVSTNNDVIMGVVKEALGDMKDREEVRIRVNPDDYHIVNNDRSSLMRMVEGLKDFDLSIDSKVTRGGCVIETNLGNIDARLETQLGAITTAFDRSGKGEDIDDGANAS